jgi:transcriptional regulator with XRE-family HTH domain
VDGPNDTFFDQAARAQLGETVKAWMDSVGTNKRKLALATGMSRTTLDAILSGSRETSLELVARLAATLNTTTGALVDGQMPTNPPPGDSRLPATAARPGSLEERVATLEHDLGVALAMAEAALERVRHLPSSAEQGRPQ